VAATAVPAATVTAASTMTAAAAMTTTMLSKLGCLGRGSAARGIRNNAGADRQSGDRTEGDHRALDREELHCPFSFVLYFVGRRFFFRGSYRWVSARLTLIAYQ
jgi:hypothetical protein